MSRLPLTGWLLLLMPLVAVAGKLSSLHAIPDTSDDTDLVASTSAGTHQLMIPLWRGANGLVLSLQSYVDCTDVIQRGSLLSFHSPGALHAEVASSRLLYGFTPHLSAHVGVNNHFWGNRTSHVVGAELGVSYDTHRYSVELSVGANDLRRRSLPNGSDSFSGVNGLNHFDSSTQFNMHGQLMLSHKRSIGIGISLGPIRLLPSRVIGLNRLDQKALSLDFHDGSVSGSIIGHVMQSSTGWPGAVNGDYRWSSIDLGMTWYLPWKGFLSFGTENVWYSGLAVKASTGSAPYKSRTPYIKYHQDL